MVVVELLLVMVRVLAALLLMKAMVHEVTMGTSKLGLHACRTSCRVRMPIIAIQHVRAWVITTVTVHRESRLTIHVRLLNGDLRLLDPNG